MPRGTRSCSRSSTRRRCAPQRGGRPPACSSSRGRGARPARSARSVGARSDGGGRCVRAGAMAWTPCGRRGELDGRSAGRPRRAPRALRREVASGRWTAARRGSGLVAARALAPFGDARRALRRGAGERAGGGRRGGRGGCDAAGEASAPGRRRVDRRDLGRRQAQRRLQLGPEGGDRAGALARIDRQRAGERPLHPVGDDGAHGARRGPARGISGLRSAIAPTSPSKGGRPTSTSTMVMARPKTSVQGPTWP